MISDVYCFIKNKVFRKGDDLYFEVFSVSFKDTSDKNLVKAISFLNDTELINEIKEFYDADDVYYAQEINKVFFLRKMQDAELI